MRVVRDRVFIGCEGASERSYVAWLQRQCDEVGIAVHLDTHVVGGGDPLTVAESSAKACLARARVAGNYVYAFVLLDHDLLGVDPMRDAKISRSLSAARLTTIYQYEVHEAFLSRHFEKYKNRRPPKSATEALIQKAWPGYTKPLAADDLSKRLSFDNLYTASTVEPDLKMLLELMGLFI